jgi:hypothetical protein
MKEAPVVAGAFLSLSIIADGVELTGHADLLVWRGDLSFGGLTRFGSKAGMVACE